MRSSFSIKGFKIIGKLDVKEHQATTKKRRDNLYKECVNFHFPITGSSSELSSFEQSIKNRRNVNEIGESAFREVAKYMSNFYPRVKPPALAQKCDDKRSVEQYLKTIDWDVWFQEIIKLDSSPGYPYTILGKTNKGILSDYRQVIIDLTIDRFIRLIGISLGELQDMNYRDLLDNNLVDPVRLFVKQEPHPSRKFLTGKMRLISSVSIVDQLVERLFHSYINNKFIEQWVNIPSKPGIGLTTDADFSCIIDQFNLIKKTWYN